MIAVCRSLGHEVTCHTSDMAAISLALWRIEAPRVGVSLRIVSRNVFTAVFNLEGLFIHPDLQNLCRRPTVKYLSRKSSVSIANHEGLLSV